MSEIKSRSQYRFANFQSPHIKKPGMGARFLSLLRTSSKNRYLIVVHTSSIQTVFVASFSSRQGMHSPIKRTYTMQCKRFGEQCLQGNVIIPLWIIGRQSTAFATLCSRYVLSSPRILLEKECDRFLYQKSYEATLCERTF